VTIVAAGTPAELAAIQALVRAAGLPEDGIGAVPTDWFVVRSDGGPIGAIGVEIHDGTGLLRSLVVDPAWRAQGIGSLLADAAEVHGDARGLASLYLLTDTAEGFFTRRGWRRIGRDAAPPAIMASVEWATACGESAVPMVRP
jgi:amino-acid N-acetyltransferase